MTYKEILEDIKNKFLKLIRFCRSNWCIIFNYEFLKYIKEYYNLNNIEFILNEILREDT